MNELLPMLQEGLTTIAGAVITLLAAYAVRAINTYTIRLRVEALKLSNDEQRTLAETAIARLNALATTTVTAFEQTTAKALREAVKAGKADPDELKQLSQDALYQIKFALAPEYLQVIEETYGDAEEYILKVIEQKVWQVKNAPLAADIVTGTEAVL